MAVKGVILGDIAGSKYEGLSAVAFGEDPKTVDLYTDTHSFTDDTVMTLAIKQAVETGIPYDKAMRRVGQSYPYCGYGGNFIAWMFAADYHPYGSYGNGSAMRSSFIGEYYDDIEKVKEEAKKSAEVTHDHPEGIKGAVVTAVLVWMAKHGKTKEEMKEYFDSEYPIGQYKYSGKTVEELQCYGAPGISCQDSLPTAFICFYEANSYDEFIRNVLSIKCDTDTICAIGGGFAEEYFHGTYDNADELLKEYLPEDLLDILNGKHVETYYRIRVNDAANKKKPYIVKINNDHYGDYWFSTEKRASEFTKNEIILDESLSEMLEGRDFTLEKTREVDLTT